MELNNSDMYVGYALWFVAGFLFGYIVLGALV